MAKVQKRFIGFAALVAVFFLSAAAGWAAIDPSTVQKLVAGDGADLDYFGHSVSVDGDTAVIGVYGDDNNRGSAYIFVRSGSGWSQQAKLQASDGVAGDYFGISVSISGETVIVGSYSAESAYVFIRSGSSWSQQAKLSPYDGGAGDFGWSVSVFDDTAVIGTRYSGSAYVFVRSGGNWNQQAELLTIDGTANDNFGCSVSISDNTIVVGACNDSKNGPASGSAYVFTLNGAGVWSQQAKLLPTDGAADDGFGESVSVDGDTVLIGSDKDDDNGEWSGSAYVFVRSGGTWSQQAKLTVAGDEYDLFGDSVSVSGDIAVIGAGFENGTGAAYIFVRSDKTWSQQIRLTAPNPAVQDWFGCSVFISDNTVIIGAYGTDNNGSVYIYGSSQSTGALPAILSLLSGRKTISSTLNDNVVAVDENSATDIVTSTIGATGETTLRLSGEMANTTQNGSILYMLPGSDGRFPFGFAGRVANTTSNTDGTKTVELQEVSYADVIQESSIDIENITLDASNFVGVIAPSAIQAASPMPMAAMSDVPAEDFYSFRDGAIVVRNEKQESLLYSFAEAENAVNAGTVSLNMRVDLGKMGDGIQASTMRPINIDTPLGFFITGSLDNIKLTNENEFSLLGGGLKSLNLRVDGDLNFDVKFNGNGTIKFGYFSQAWNEVKDESFKAFGVSAKLIGLSSDDKIGKYPLAGLVFSVPCLALPQKFCRIKSGKTQTPLRQAKALGVIVWLYMTIDGEFSLDGDLTLAHLNPGRLSLGIKKTSGGDFQLIRSLERKSSTGRFIEAPKFRGTFGAQYKTGISVDIDFFASGVRIANAGTDIGTLIKASLTGEVGYGADTLSSPWSWDGNACFTGSIGAGAVFRAAAELGIEIDTRWKDISGAFQYEFQDPDEEKMNEPGRHGLLGQWYTFNGLTKCIGLPDIQITTPGDGWIDYTGSNGFYIRGTVDTNQIPVPERITLNIYNGRQEIICSAQYYDQWNFENYIYDDTVDKSVTATVDPVTGSFEAAVDFNSLQRKEQLEAVAHIPVGETEVQTKTSIWKADGTAIVFDTNTKILLESNLDECMERWGCTSGRAGRRVDDPCMR